MQYMSFEAHGATMRRWKGRRVLVTGSAGFIGSHLVEALVAAGADVRALVRYSSTRGLGALSEIGPDCRPKVYYGDLRDAAAVERAVAGCEVIFHLGALISIPYSYENPGAYLETNLFGTYHVLEACRRHEAGRCVVVSSSEVYGSALYVPIDEGHPLQAQSPYSASKIAAEKLAESYWRSFGLPVSVVRPFNTYGPRQSTRAVIPQVLSQLLLGNRVVLGNLAPRRDFLYVRDTVTGLMAVAASEAAVGETFNLGTGCDVSIEELAALAGEILHRSPELSLDQARTRPETSEVTCLKADAGKAKLLLGWVPAVQLEEGLRHTAAWLSARTALSGEYHI